MSTNININSRRSLAPPLNPPSEVRQRVEMVDPPSIGSSDSLSIVEVNNTFGIIKFIAIQPTPVAEGCPGLNGAPTNPTEIYLCTSFKTLDLFPNGAGDLELLTELTFNQSYLLN